jgi:ubiquinone/menaquinone biosynthesis C-methylase UbiE
VADRKRDLFGGLSGTILEIGPGPGNNAALFTPGSVWIAVEPNLAFHARLRNVARAHGLDLRLFAGTAEALPLDAGSVDAAVSTYVLCTVTDVQRSLAEIRRILRPGGRYRFIEHVAAPPQTGMRSVQHILTPLWKRLTCGCNPHRDLEQEIAAARFDTISVDHFKIAVPVTAPHIAGWAERG